MVVHRGSPGRGNILRPWPGPPLPSQRHRYVPSVRNGWLPRVSGALLLSGALAGCPSVVPGTASPAAHSASASSGATALEAAMLQPGDLPADWRAVGQPARDTGMMTTFRTCLGTQVDPGAR